MKYFIKIRRPDEISCFYALCNKNQALKIITEFWSTFNPDEYEIIIELMEE